MSVFVTICITLPHFLLVASISSILFFFCFFASLLIQSIILQANPTRNRFNYSIRCFGYKYIMFKRNANKLRQLKEPIGVLAFVVQSPTAFLPQPTIDPPSLYTHRYIIHSIAKHRAISQSHQPNHCTLLVRTAHQTPNKTVSNIIFMNMRG